MISDIGSGIYTGRETKRIRKTYRIKGTYCDDIAKGIFCQPCSLIRNDLEIRRREKDREIEITLGLRAPVPLGEQAFRPMYAMPITEGYRAEPQMSTSSVPQDTNSKRGEGVRKMPLYPTEQDLREANNAWGGVIDLPQIPDVSSPLVDLERRPQLLTPISEHDSTESPLVQHLDENTPYFPQAHQVHRWLKSMGTPSDKKASTEKPVVAPNQGNLPISSASSKTHLDSGSPNSRKKPTSPPKPSRKGKVPSPKAGKESETREASDVHATPTLETIAATQQLPKAVHAEPATTAYADRKVETLEIRRSPKHNLSAEGLVLSPEASERQHSLEVDVLAPRPSVLER